MRNNFFEYGYFRYVHCPLCRDGAGVKWTRTDKLMIRCEFCKTILFANSYASQERLMSLPEFNNTIYVSLENDDFVALIEPRAMSINPSAGLLYLASGDSHWFNVIDMNTSKVIAANTEIAYPIASAVDNITGKVYVADCRLCDDYDFTNGSSIYELDSNGSTIDWKNYENINLDENELAINPFTKKLYVIGTDLESGMSNIDLYPIPAGQL